jgi:hypothetical protein
MAQREEIILGLRQACFHLQAVDFEGFVLPYIVRHQAVELAVTLQRNVEGLDAAERLQDAVIHLLDVVHDGLALQPQLFLGHGPADLLELDVQSEAVELRQRLGRLGGDKGRELPLGADRLVCGRNRSRAGKCSERTLGEGKFYGCEQIRFEEVHIEGWQSRGPRRRRLINLFADLEAGVLHLAVVL